MKEMRANFVPSRERMFKHEITALRMLTAAANGGSTASEAATHPSGESGVATATAPRAVGVEAPSGGGGGRYGRVGVSMRCICLPSPSPTRDLCVCLQLVRLLQRPSWQP